MPELVQLNTPFQSGDAAIIKRDGNPQNVVLGNSCVLNVGTTAGTVAAGNHSHSSAVASGSSGFLTGSDKAKLDGIEDGATANSADATQSIADQIAGSAIEVGTGTLTDGDTGTTAARLHIRVGTDGSIYVQNRESFGIVTYLTFYPTEGY